MRRATAALVLVGLLSASESTRGDEPAPPSDEALEFFRLEVYPLLEESCFKCHGGRKRIRGNFRITSRAGLVRGGDLGPGLHLESPEKSLVLEMVSYKDEHHEMPPDGKLSDEAIATLERWIRMGAPYDPKLEVHGEDEGAEAGFDPTRVSAETKRFWAFQPVRKPEVPRVDEPGWQYHPIDAFVAARLEDLGLRPNPPASKRELLRRAYYDLTGLPPDADAVRAFEADESPGAFERVVDRLLESPQYGEKWGRHWLDLVRFAETNGYERDSEKPMAWRYRDWVIRSFNEDKPYDRFLAEQLAGDELESAHGDGIVGTGFHRLGLWDDEPVDRELARYDYLDSIVSTTGEVMLGLTIGCARCHDHKIDPIPSADYYRFLAFFQNISPHGKGDANLVSIATPEERRAHEEQLRQKEAEETRIHHELMDLEREFISTARVRGEPWIEALLTSDLVDLAYRFYRDSWTALPRFDELRPETEGRVAHGFVSLAPASRADAIGLVFEGRLRIARSGQHRFHVRSKDGSRLLIDGKVVGEADGEGEHRYTARIDASVGLLPFRFEYFNRRGEPVLEIEWEDPTGSRRPLTIAAGDLGREILADCRRDAQTWRYTFESPGEGWSEERFDDSSWREGPGGFGRAGTPGAVVRTAWETSEIWLRREFEVRAAPKGLALVIHHDEIVDVFLNGTRIYHAEGYLRQYERVDLGTAAAALLHEGTNVLAVRCSQTGGGQYIDVGLVDRADSLADVASLIVERGELVFGVDRRARYLELRRELESSRARQIEAPVSKAMVVGERGRRETFVLARGNPSMQGDKVEPGFPSVLSPPEPRIVDRGETSGRRRALAEWITSPENPLTARVAVNRVWQYHFGRGIVRSSSNFGRMGDKPTHPLLLDWLAASFVEQGWRLKWLHRLIMSSRTYRMSSRSRPDGVEKDPGNDLFWRFDVRRLTAEELRDSMLHATGELNLQSGGPSFYSKLPDAILHTSSTGAGKWGRSPPDQQRRRSVYIFVRRSLLDPLMTNFDFADTDSSCAVRFATIVPTQALTLLNSEFVNERAEGLAERLAASSATELTDRVRLSFEHALSREPTEEELEGVLEFLGDCREGGATEDEALRRLALLLLNLNEFLFVD